MLGQLSKELVNVRQLRISAGRPLSKMNDEHKYRMCRILQSILLLPTIREVCFDGQQYEEELHDSLENELAVIQTLLTENNISYKDGFFRHHDRQYILPIRGHKLKHAH